MKSLSPLRSLRIILGAAAALIAFPGAAPAEGILLDNGTVVDGTGAAPRTADLLIEGDQIVKIADEIEAAEGVTVIDATGLIVAPGFIDTHAHGSPERHPEFPNFLAQGVTTILLGADGSGPIGKNAAATFERLDKSNPAVNVAYYVGHGTVRNHSGIGMSSDPSEEQIAEMAALVEEALAAGAFGLSTGLEYEPGRFSTLDELIAVAGPVGERGALVSSHMRNEDNDEVEGAIDELLAQCRATGAKAHVSHLKAVYAKGGARAEEILAKLDAARAEGVGVSADVYPYTASYTGIGIVFPGWARPPANFEEVKATRRDDLAAYLRQRITSRNGPEATLFGSQPWAGKTLAEIAADMDIPFEDVLMDHIPPGSASAAYFVMDEATMRTFLSDEATVVCSDGSLTGSHPRGHGAFPRAWRIMREEGLPPEAIIRKMTGLPAEILQMSDRGVLREGSVADIVVFDPETFKDTATFEDSHQLAEGSVATIVGGEIAWRAEDPNDSTSGVPTGTRAGKILRAPWAE